LSRQVPKHLRRESKSVVPLQKVPSGLIAINENEKILRLNYQRDYKHKDKEAEKLLIQ